MGVVKPLPPGSERNDDLHSLDFWELRQLTKSTREVCREVGITERQINYWIQRGWLKEPYRRYIGGGSGNPRYWTQRDIQRVREIQEAFLEAKRVLVAAGIEAPPQSIPRLLDSSRWVS